MTTVELHLLGPLDEDGLEESPEDTQPEVPTEDSQPDDATEEDQTDEPAQGEPDEVSPPSVPAEEEAEDSEEEWIAPRAWRRVLNTKSRITSTRRRTWTHSRDSATSEAITFAHEGRRRGSACRALFVGSCFIGLYKDLCRIVYVA